MICTFYEMFSLLLLFLPPIVLWLKIVTMIVMIAIIQYKND